MFNPEFFGKLPPKWFIGQVPLGQTVNLEDPKGWGDRVKVRIIGYHPSLGSDLPDDALEWAFIMRSTSHGSLNRMSTGICGGEWVIGLFLNYDPEKLQPLIVGVLGRSDPSYEITYSEAEQKKSTEFKKSLPWFKNIQPTLYHTKSNEEIGEKREQNKHNLPRSLFRK